MRLTAHVCAVALFAAVHGAAWAQAGCRFDELGFSYYRVERDGVPSAYILSAAGPNWSHSPYGWHAPGLLQCENCSASGSAAGGLYHFIEEKEADASQRLTAAARAERRRETIGFPYPYVMLGPDHLRHLGSRENISIGPFSGYAIAFGIVVSGDGKDDRLERSIGKNRIYLALKLTDGCVSFSIDVTSSASDGGNIWTPLESLLKEITVTKHSGAVPPAPYGVSVRARRESGQSDPGAWQSQQWPGRP